jgi:hypothetical protein
MHSLSVIDAETTNTLVHSKKIVILLVKELEKYFGSLIIYMETNLKNADGSSVITSNQIGYLISMKCGHRGKPNRTEERLLENLLKESGFLLLDEQDADAENSSFHTESAFMEAQKE